MAVLEVNEYKNNYNEILHSIESNKVSKVKILSVSKSHPVEALVNAYDSGLLVFGENYVQEMVDKYETISTEMKNNIEWHFIGSLQTNKVKYIAPFVNCIHSVSKLKLAKEIDKRAKENNRTIDILLQVNTSGEDSKSGCQPDEAEEVIKSSLDLENVKFIGLMTISGLESTDEERKEEFKLLRKIRDGIEINLSIDLPELSMGMTSDYHEAIEEGATMIRIGTAIFGKREYTK
ncbi:MAG: YggS family pyridoxal phosphate-dependent enzyme [Ignavibacteriae bacterium HGW-Ignavibacteriae-4]|nr:MAG: YggS family pyridoxal phosphate-dependent enzyme [Ignavibacteriae bacterium HGW-Ignavibacteriae-4]